MLLSALLQFVVSTDYREYENIYREYENIFMKLSSIVWNTYLVC